MAADTSESSTYMQSIDQAAIELANTATQTAEDISMIAGEIVEIASKDEFFSNPKHPYLESLIASMPQNGMKVLEGNPCSLIDLPEGCRFHERCAMCTEKCASVHPDMIKVSDNHEVRCFKYD